MPVYQDAKWDKFSRWVLFHLTETDDELLHNLNLTLNQQKKYEALKPKRRREFLGLRLCLKQLGLEKQEVYYNEKGKPNLFHNQHISITHSHGMVAVGLSDFSIGVDLELERTEKLYNIKRKFIREDEDFFANLENEGEYLHVIWGIKESLYKLTGGIHWNFLKNYKVEAFDLKENSLINCWVMLESSSRKFSAYYRKLDDYYFVWVLDY